MEMSSTVRARHYARFTAILDGEGVRDALAYLVSLTNYRFIFFRKTANELMCMRLFCRSFNFFLHRIRFSISNILANASPKK